VSKEPGRLLSNQAPAGAESSPIPQLPSPKRNVDQPLKRNLSEDASAAVPADQLSCPQIVEAKRVECKMNGRSFEEA
jgi:hypothetical protein